MRVVFLSKGVFSLVVLAALSCAFALLVVPFGSAAVDFCAQLGVANNMSVPGVYTLSVDHCVYQGDSGSIYANVTQYVGDISGANLSIMVAFPAEAGASVVLERRLVAGGAFSAFTTVNDSSFNWTNQTLTEWRINFSVAQGFQGKFNVSFNLSGNFAGAWQSASYELDPIVSCNPPASGDWVVNESQWLVCSGQAIALNASGQNLYVRGNANATFNTTTISGANSTVFFLENASVVLDASSVNAANTTLSGAAHAVLVGSSVAGRLRVENGSELNLSGATISLLQIVQYDVSPALAVRAGLANSSITQLWFSYLNNSVPLAEVAYGVLGPASITLFNVTLTNAQFNLTYQNATINPSLVSGSTNVLNATSMVTLRGTNYTNPVVLREGSHCVSPQCSIIAYDSLGAANFAFNFSVASWSSPGTYSASSDVFAPILTFNLTGGPAVAGSFWVAGNYSDDYVDSATYRIYAQGNPANVWANGSINASTFNMSFGGAYLPVGVWVANVSVNDTSGNRVSQAWNISSLPAIVSVLNGSGSQSATLNASQNQQIVFPFMVFLKGAQYVKMFVNLSAGSVQFPNIYATIGSTFSGSKATTASPDYAGAQSFSMAGLPASVPSYVQNSSGIYNATVNLYLTIQYGGVSAGTYSGVYGWGLSDS